MIDIQIKGLENIRKTLSPSMWKQAERRTMKDIAKVVRTDIARQARGRYNIKMSALRRAGKIKVSTSGGGLSAIISYSGQRLNIADYGARKSAGGVRYQVLRGKKSISKNAFITKLGRRAAAKRADKSIPRKYWGSTPSGVGPDGRVWRLPLAKPTGPSAAGVVRGTILKKRLLQKYGSEYSRRFPSVLAGILFGRTRKLQRTLAKR